MTGLATSGRSLAWAVPIFAEAAALGRSIVFAWSLGPDELGRAMMLALTVRLAEMASDVGIERLILQAPDGNSATLQSGLQGVSLARGVLMSILILAMAPILANIFADGPTTIAYSVLAAVPFIRGFANLDFRRAERRCRYGKMAAIEVGATLAMILCVLPAAWLVNDHRAMCIVLIAHAITFTGLSHLVAHRRYQLHFSTATVLRVWRFGGPLILNAILLFFTFYADRLIVASTYDWATLALYGVALQLALLPAQIVGRAAASLFMPRLREALRTNRLAVVWRPILSCHVLLASAMLAGFAVIAPPVIAIIYGGDFRPDPSLALALGAAAAFRILRTPFSLLAVAAGRTGDPARANAVRILALAPAAVFAACGLPLAAIAATAAVGEAGATLRAIQLSILPKDHLKMKEAIA